MRRRLAEIFAQSPDAPASWLNMSRFCIARNQYAQALAGEGHAPDAACPTRSATTGEPNATIWLAIGISVSNVFCRTMVRACITRLEKKARCPCASQPCSL